MPSQLFSTEILKEPQILISAHVQMDVLIVYLSFVHIDKIHVSTDRHSSVVPQVSECSIEDYLVAMG